MDTREVLILQETKEGTYLHLTKTEKILLIIEKGKIQNKLTKKQMAFANSHI